MALPVTIPNAFANATASIPLSQLDTNFNTLANAVNGISDGSETLANVTATVGNITTVNATTVDTTNIEVTNIKAKDGTAAVVLTDSTGAVAVSTPLTANGGVVFNESGADVDFRVEGDTDANLLFVDASTDRVGIGTNTPAQLFSVVDTSNTDDFQMRIGQAANSGNNSYDIGRNTSATGFLTFYGNQAGGNGYSFGGVDGTRMVIDTSGNVGIGGTPSTATRTTVQNVGSPVGYWVSSGVMQIQANAIFNSIDKFIGTGYGLYYAQDPSSGTHSWVTSSASGTAGNTITWTERARITSGGYLKASPNATYNDLSGPYHEFNQNSTNNISVGSFNSSASPFGYLFETTADPNNGTNYGFRYAANSGAVGVYTIYSNGTTAARSDAKWKKNIETTRDGYAEDLARLRVVKYNWYNHEDGTPKELGLIAQEVEEVFPGLVLTEKETSREIRTREVEKTRIVTEAVLDEDGNEVEPAVTETYTEEEEYTEKVATGEYTKSIKFSVFVPMLIKVCQEQQQRIETLEAKVAALEGN